MKKLFYKPEAFNVVAADAIPFYANGEYHIFYLLDYRDANNIGTPWFKVTTKDFVHYVDHGEMLKRGSENEYDMFVFTGSVIQDKEGLYHIWYTGHNTSMEPGNYLQAVMHAVSKDLDHWEKIKEDTFLNYPGYEKRDWRDPYVYYDESDELYHMLLSTRKEGQPKRLRGTTAMLMSKDLHKWSMSEDFYAPNLYYAHECPDFFQIGEWYYHVFSEFSRYHVTRYVMSKSIKGPWIKPENDKFDGRAFYAAKTVSDGNKRYVIGWNPTKEGNVDKGLWQWGGELEAHEVIQNEDGTLSVKMIDEINSSFEEQNKLTFKDYLGNQKDVSKLGNINSADIAYASINGNEETYRIDVDFTFEEGTSRVGVLLNADVENDAAYGYFIEPLHNRLIFELYPVFPQYSFTSVYLERPIHIKTGEKVHMSILVEGTIAVCYVNNQIALSTRMYDFSTDKVGLLVHGKADFSNIKFYRLK